MGETDRSLSFRLGGSVALRAIRNRHMTMRVRRSMTRSRVYSVESLARREYRLRTLSVTVSMFVSECEFVCALGVLWSSRDLCASLALRPWGHDVCGDVRRWRRPR